MAQIIFEVGEPRPNPRYWVEINTSGGWVRQRGYASAEQAIEEAKIQAAGNGYGIRSRCEARVVDTLA